MMKHPVVLAASSALLVAMNTASAVTFGPGRVSKFAVPGVGNGVLVGASGATWSDFSGKDHYGTKTFVNAGIVDAEKTAARDDDDTWCYQIADMDALFITGWAAKTSYTTVDAMKRHFNASLLRSDSFVEGKYGFVKDPTWGDFFDWYKDQTGISLTGNGSLTGGTIGASFASTLAKQMGDGSHVVRVNVVFEDILKNPRWTGLGIYGMTHGVLCVGYVSSGTTLKALFIIDPDNDQFSGTGGTSAPNSVLYCPVSWVASSQSYAISGVWGQQGALLPQYRALAMMTKGTPASFSYKVKFNANGGKGKMATQKMTGGKSAKLRKNAFTRSGYVFIGWAKSKKGAVAYKNAAAVKNLTSAGKTATLYAKWAKKSYKVAFYANGGKGKMATQKMTYGKAKKLSANKFKRSGHTFQGWAKSKNGKVAYKDRTSVKNLVTTGKTVKLYAVWKKKSSPSPSPDDMSYHVFFDANGGAGQMYAQQFDHDVSQALSANAFVRPGFVFAGWAKTATGAIVYSDRQTVRNLSNGASVWLYAVWRSDPNSPVQSVSFGGFSFVTDKATPWSATTVEGVKALVSAPIGDNKSSTLYLTLNGPGTLSFKMRVLCEVGSDRLKATYPDGSFSISGLGGSWDQRVVSIPAGTYTVTWTYEKDAAGSSSSDCGWISDVTWTK